MHRVRVAAILPLVVPVMLAACGDGGADPTTAEPVPTTSSPPISLSRSGSCGDAYFWVANESGNIAVTVFVEVRERSATDPTTVAFEATDAVVEIDVLRGNADMTQNFCNDVVLTEAEPTSTVGAASGTGTILVGPRSTDPRTQCGIEGALVLDGLVATDGTTFAPISATSAGIGCYAG